MPPCTPGKRAAEACRTDAQHSRTLLYALNKFVPNRISAEAFVNGVTKLATPEFQTQRDVIASTASYAAQLMHLTLQNVDIAPDCDYVRSLDVFMAACTCIAVKVHIETDTPYSEALYLLDKTALPKKELVMAEATILQATDWMRGIRGDEDGGRDVRPQEPVDCD